jgi:hypothetical protein
MIGATIRFAKVASKIVTVALAAKNGYDFYQKGKKIKKAYNIFKKQKNKVKKIIKII